jgi:hypothetical protein
LKECVMPDLWPTDLGEPYDITPPVALLREQGVLLAKKTQGAVEGRVLLGSQLGSQPGEFTLQFYLVAPSLDNYSFRLFTVVHGIDPYPLRIVSEVEGVKENCSNEEEFMEQLRKILASAQTRRVVRALRAQVEAATT